MSDIHLSYLYTHKTLMVYSLAVLINNKLHNWLEHITI